MENTSPIIVAIDCPSLHQAKQLWSALDPTLCRLKIGKTLFTAAGPQAVASAMESGFEVFLDLKFHDIPQTVMQACKVASSLGVWMLTLHASGGLAMLQAAHDAVATYKTPPLLIAVTVLTSMVEADLRQIGIEHSVQNQVVTLAKLAQNAHLDGVVCSANEASILRECFGNSLCIVSPGIRLSVDTPYGLSLDDQLRTTTPLQAIKAGVNYMVIGRPITQAPNPSDALAKIYDEVKNEYIL